jgi:hypothetical protein
LKGFNKLERLSLDFICKQGEPNCTLLNAKAVFSTHGVQEQQFLHEENALAYL